MRKTTYFVVLFLLSAICLGARLDGPHLTPSSVTSDRILDGTVAPVDLDRAYVDEAGDTMTGDLNINADLIVQTSTMVVTGGRVGIGTTSPGSALEVVGQIRHSLGIISEGVGSGSVTGDARGLSAIDLQTIRTSAGQVASGDFSTISGGENNLASGIRSTVGGGLDNQAVGSRATVAGGNLNIADGTTGFIGGGKENTTGSTFGNFVGAGLQNSSSGGSAVVVGGLRNTASGGNSFIGSGEDNIASGSKAGVVSGEDNIASGAHAAVLGGIFNTASGDESWAGGTQAKATTKGSFVWADSQGVDLITSATDQFLVRAQGGFSVDSSSVDFNNGGTSRLFIENSGRVGIGTTSPSSALHVSSAATSAATPILIVSSGTGAGQELLRVRGDGNVGIGTTSPGRPLHIVDDRDFLARFESTDGFSGISLRDNSTTAGDQVIVAAVGDAMRLRTLNTDRMAITSAGNVGIATVIPAARLHVSSSNAVAADTILQVSSGTATGQELLVVKGDGNVGIGTTSPDNSLHVVGGSTYTVKFSSGIIFEEGHLQFPDGTQQFSAGGGVELGDSPTWTGDHAWNNILKVPSGSAASPSVQFTSDLDTGFKRGGADIFTIVTGGTDRLLVSATTISRGIGFRAPNGAGSTPSYAFENDGDTGFSSQFVNVIMFTTGGIEQMRLDADGNFGIGVTNPAARLEVVPDAANNFTVQFSSADGTAQFVLDKDGLVGIGTTEPEAPLHVVGDSTTTGTAFAASFDTLGSTYKLNGVVVIDANRNFVGNELSISNSAIGADFTIETSTFVVVDGRVGIGTAGPLSKLAVAQAPDTGTIEFRLGSNEASARDIIIRKDTTTPFETHFISAASPTSDAGTLRFFTSDQASGERMVIQFGGNVGIGTSNPGSLLEINGEMRAGQRTSADCCSDPPQRVGEWCYDTSLSDMFFSTGTVANQYKQAVGVANCG